MITALLFWLMTAILGAAGLHTIASRHAPGLYLAPAARTVAVLAVAATYIVIIWSH